MMSKGATDLECGLSKQSARTLHCGRQRGFSLIEVMIGLFVLAIGLLGMASLQNNAVRLNNTSFLYTQATLLAQDMTERLRANREALSDYATGFNDVVVAGTDCSANNCTKTQLAKWDVVRWRAALSAALPGVESDIEVNGENVTIQVRFDDDQGDQQAAENDPLLVQISTRI